MHSILAGHIEKSKHTHGNSEKSRDIFAYRCKNVYLLMVAETCFLCFKNGVFFINFQIVYLKKMKKTFN